MKVEETHVNRTEGYLLGDPEVIDSENAVYGDDPGEIYRFCLKNYGRCSSKVYVDTDEGTKAVGWVFEKTDHYEDTGEPFIHETWVTLYDDLRREVIEHKNYHAIN